MNVNHLIIGVTVLMSWMAFKNGNLIHRYIFNAYQVYQRKEWYRLISHGFIHADWGHLIFNMITLWFFGSAVLEYFEFYFEGKGIGYYLILYLGGMLTATLYSLEKHKNNPSYNALGASGAVSAVLFSSIVMNPTSGIMMILFPIPIPGWLFGILYLWYSSYMSKKGLDNVGHDAHLWGAVYGLLATLALRPAFLTEFFDKIVG